MRGLAAILLVLRSAALATEDSTVFFYFLGTEIPGTLMVGTPSPPIVVDGKTVAKIKKGTWFGVNLPSGPHTFAGKGFRTSTAETEIKIDLRPGESSYVRVEAVIGTMKWWAYLRIVTPEDARAAMAKLKPLDAGNIEDKARVTTVPPTDAGASRAQDRPMRNEDVIALKTAGMNDDVILDKIRSSAPEFDLSESGLAKLKAANVSSSLVDAMRETATASRPQK
jgi:hypothetical protein